ncbi:Spermidine N(1)-acetyltransferase [subsurface metagenome]
MSCNIKLRALTSSDKTKTLTWNNQVDIKQLYAGHPFPVNLEMESDWYEKILRSNVPTTVFGIEFVSEKKLIGLTILKNINLIHRKAEFAIFIGDKEERGKGYSRTATQKTLAFGFNQLGLNRIYLNVQKNNEVAIKLYESIGFIIEGEVRKSIYKDGQFYNEYIMSILNNEFLQKN